MLQMTVHQQKEFESGDEVQAEDVHQQDPEEDDPYWVTYDTPDDRGNEMPLAEAQGLDEEVATKVSAEGKFDSLPPMAPLLYPDLVQQHDADILEKLQGLTRDSQITLPDGAQIPYWQTVQYLNRNIRIFITRFSEGKFGKKVFDHLPGSERTVAWEISALARKILASDCAYQLIVNDPKYPSKLSHSKKDYRGAAFSGAIFYKHIEGDITGTYMRASSALKKACAVATGRAVTFNNKNKFSEKDTRQATGCYAHEQAHNMGYHHKDVAPGGIQRAVLDCYKNSVKYKTYDLAETPAFEVK